MLNGADALQYRQLLKDYINDFDFCNQMIHMAECHIDELLKQDFYGSDYKEDSIRVWLEYINEYTKKQEEMLHILKELRKALRVESNMKYYSIL